MLLRSTAQGMLSPTDAVLEPHDGFYKSFCFLSNFVFLTVSLLCSSRGLIVGLLSAFCGLPAGASYGLLVAFLWASCGLPVGFL